MAKTVYIRKIKYLMAILVIVMLSLTVSGCWDRRELQERIFVLAAAVDTADSGQKPSQSPEAMWTESFHKPGQNKTYRLSVQLLNLEPGKGEKTGGKMSTYVLSGTGNSLFEIVRDLLEQSSRGLWWEHAQCIIISEDALRQNGLRAALDFFSRDSEMRSRMRVLITQGEARPFLEYKPPNNEPSGMFFSGIVALHKRNINMAGARSYLGDIIQALDNQNGVFIPRLVQAGDTVKVKGVAIIDNKGNLAGYGDEKFVAGIKMIGGTEKSAVFRINCPVHPDKALAFELFRHDTKLTPRLVDGKLIFYLDKTLEGNIGEMQCSHDTDDPQFLQKLEQLFAQEIKNEILTAYAYSQQFGVDQGLFLRKVKVKYPDYWEQVKDNWPAVYSTIPLNVSVNVSIRKVGEHK